MKSAPKAATLVVENAALARRIEVSRLSVGRGECLVLCGPNGSGKSSLLRLLCGLEASEGTVRLGELDVATAPRLRVAEQIAWLPQRPYLGPYTTCESIVRAARYRFLEGPEKATEEARRVLSEQGIAHLATRSAGEVSGGELQRVLIASLVAQEAPFLLVDEPANHLDPHHQVSTYKRLGHLWRDEGRAVVVVTHDVRLAALLGPRERVRVQGVKEGKLLPETTLADPNLASLLSDLYGVTYVAPEQPGGLAVDLTTPLSEPFGKGEGP